MDDFTKMRILVPMILDKRVQNTEERIEWYSFFPTYLLTTEDFIRSIKDVLHVRRSVVFYRWRKYFDTCYKTMLSSHFMYVTFMMFACINEHECNQNIFESFISVCALVKLLSEETLQKTGLNLYNLNHDIITLFYKGYLQDIFNRRGGFRRLEEYIRDHRYLAWKLNEGYSVPPDDPTQIELDEKLKKEFKKYRVIGKEINPEQPAEDEASKILANGVLGMTLAQLPALPSYLELKRVIAYRQNNSEKDPEEKGRAEANKKPEANSEALHGCSSLISNSKTNYDADHPYSIERIESIIQAVIRHNHSKSSSDENANNRIQEEAGVLEHLENTIKSLIEVLNEFDKE